MFHATNRKRNTYSVDCRVEVQFSVKTQCSELLCVLYDKTEDVSGKTIELNIVFTFLPMHKLFTATESRTRTFRRHCPNLAASFSQFLAHKTVRYNSGVPRHSVISTLCKSFVFSSDLRVRV